MLLVLVLLQLYWDKRYIWNSVIMNHAIKISHIFIREFRIKTWGRISDGVHNRRYQMMKPYIILTVHLSLEIR